MTNSKKTMLAKAEMHRIAKKAGANRISNKASEELSMALEDYGIKLIRKASTYTEISNHPKTLKAIDIRQALKQG